jgi:hypothetical protein
VNRLFIVVQNAGYGAMRFYVVLPSTDQYNGEHIGDLFVGGSCLGDFGSLTEAVNFIRNN